VLDLRAKVGAEDEKLKAAYNVGQGCMPASAAFAGLCLHTRSQLYTHTLTYTRIRLHVTHTTHTCASYTHPNHTSHTRAHTSVF